MGPPHTAGMLPIPLIAAMEALCAKDAEAVIFTHVVWASSSRTSYALEGVLFEDKSRAGWVVEEYV